MDTTVTPFSELLRRRTRRSPGSSTGDGLLRDLAAGTCDVADHADLLGQYAFVYEALERAAERMADHPVVAPFVTQHRSRMPAIRADLEYLVGPDWSELVCPLPATTAYVRRLNEVAATWPGGFVAHHYTRYLGDLSGGRAIGTVLSDRFGFETNGVLFWICEQVADPAAFEDTYREQLDRAPWDADEQERVIAEVELAHALDRRLLAELEALRVPSASAVHH
ncbi:heme oxygenase [Curtobacterium luteum]|uniref:Heme oxygenase n=1 Tax=Curtobacterium luteum TaxID=33881 RepID=A0A8H9G733_9MICO|nr:biliverdin-producing heme oxygenase [Curtobacterium luteum]MBM7801375.1 heme oxygenase [Curtobacterium luteum]NUU49871.1 biliverdin-producing heme oxygenase [Curtobacterium luteum]GGK90993.1 biliverdin-producing heme oxygenase [Curtobacterium luteum]